MILNVFGKFKSFKEKLGKRITKSQTEKLINELNKDKEK